MCDVQSVHKEDSPQSSDKLSIVELIPKKRGRTVRYISAATCLLAGSIVIAIGVTYPQVVYFPSASVETQKNKTDVAACYGKAKKLTFSCLFTVAFVLLGVELGALVDPLSRLAEECRHRHQRYEGSWKKIIKACLSGILFSRLLFMLCLTIAFILVIFVTDRPSIDDSHLVMYVFTGVSTGPLLQLLDQNIESEVYLSTLLEEKGMNMANVLGWSYYFTNLKPAAERFVGKKKLGHHAELSLDKLLLVIPLDYSTTDDLQQIDSHIKLSQIDEHSFHYSVYRLSTAEEQRDRYFAIHYVQQPLRTLRSMTLFQRVEAANIKTFDGEVKLLYRTLSEILAINKDIEETCLLVPIKTKNLESLKHGGLVKSIMDAVNCACVCEKTITCTICKRKARDKPPKQTEQKRSIREVFGKISNYGATGSTSVNV